jgi:serine/threonine protein kinase
MLPNEVIDRKYQIIRLLGEGGMGAVYEAHHLATGRRVAVKVLTDELSRMDEALARFHREARISRDMVSPHIAQVVDAGTDPRTRHPYIVMEYLAGEDLDRVLESRGNLPVDLALRIGAQACLGLESAHRASVVHRDIKPANIFLARLDAGQVVVKLLDFGIAKPVSPQHKSLTKTGSVLGSPHYMSPEQAMAEKGIDLRTDIWSLGAVLYQLISGSPPFGEKDTIGALVLAIVTQAPPPLQKTAPWVPDAVAAVVHRALTRSRDQRFQSAADMFAAIQALLPHGHALDERMLTTSATAPLGPAHTEPLPQALTGSGVRARDSHEPPSPLAVSRPSGEDETTLVDAPPFSGEAGVGNDATEIPAAEVVNAFSAPHGAGDDDLTLAQYAQLCAEIDTWPEDAEKIFARYGLADADRRGRVNQTWLQRLDGDPAAKTAWHRAYKQYREQFASVRRARAKAGT